MTEVAVSDAVGVVPDAQAVHRYALEIPAGARRTLANRWLGLIQALLQLAGQLG